MLQREGDGEGRVAGEVDEWRREGEMVKLDRGYGLAGYLGGRKVVCAGRQGGQRGNGLRHNRAPLPQGHLPHARKIRSRL